MKQTFQTVQRDLCGTGSPCLALHFLLPPTWQFLSFPFQASIYLQPALFSLLLSLTSTLIICQFFLHCQCPQCLSLFLMHLASSFLQTPLSLLLQSLMLQALFFSSFTSVLQFSFLYYVYVMMWYLFTFP